MAPSAFSRARLVSELTRPRTSSPRDEEYATATSLSFNPARDAIHSTGQFENIACGPELPMAGLPRSSQNYQLPGVEDDNESEGSASMMSIELGRGVKRGAQDVADDISTNATFNLGNDSLYEITGTPPIRSKNYPRQGADTLRRHASINRAVETVKTRSTQALNSGENYRSIFDALKNTNKASAQLPRQRQTSVPSRFASNAAQAIPLRSKAMSNYNPTVESNQSFLLPENFPDLTELVAGTRQDGTPVFNRHSKPRSRFTSASRQPQQPEYNPIGGVPLPDEEKAIYTSIQLLNERVVQLEGEKLEAERRAEEYEDQVVDLENRLSAIRNRQDSAVGSDEDIAGPGVAHRESTKLMASAKSLQTHLDRSERKLSLAEIAAKRMREERDKLVQQIGKAYFDFEEIKSENEALKELVSTVQGKNADLQQELDLLREQGRRIDRNPTMAHKVSNRFEQMHRQKHDSRARTQSEEMGAATVRPEANLLDRLSKKQHDSGRSKASDMATNTGRRSDGQVTEDIESRVAREVQKHRDRTTRANADSDQHRPSHRSRSKSQRRHSAAVDEFGTKTHTADHNDAAAKAETMRIPRSSMKTAHRTTSSERITGTLREEDSRDYTLLSFTDPNEVANLRRKLEDERRAARLRETTTALHQDGTTQYSSAGLQRKSSLKDVTATLGFGGDQGTGQGDIADPIARMVKNVRVQSPRATSDTLPDQHIESTDATLLSNISRRRRRALSADGDTSAFILPDITLHHPHATHLAFEKAHVPHDPVNCTACPDGKNVQIPEPVSVTERTEYDPDVTNATIRPAESPAVALATVLKQLEDEIKHLKQRLAVIQAYYNQHDPAVSKSKRTSYKLQIDKLLSEIEKRSNQVYALYDVLEGQKQTAARSSSQATEQQSRRHDMTQDELNDTLQSVGMDAAEISGRVGRGAAPIGLDGLDELSESGDELPWEGLSDFSGNEDN